MKNKKKILIIEDEAALIKVYRKRLGKEYELGVCSHGDEGVDKARKEKPDLVILDIILSGGKNGFDVLKDLKSNNETKNIPVLMVTNLDTEQKKEAMDAGAVDYIVKTSVTLDEIIKRIKKYI